MNNTYYHFLDKKLCFLDDCYALIEKIEMSLRCSTKIFLAKVTPKVGQQKYCY